MKVLTLAAGRGSRLEHQTETKPKCMTVVQNKPILYWQQKAQDLAGVNMKAAVLGYHAEQIKHYFQQTFINEQWHQSNMVSSLLKADNIFQREDVVISYSDIVYHPNDLLLLSQSAGDIVVAYDPNWLEQWKLRFDDPLSDAETLKLAGNKIIEIGCKPSNLDEIEGQFLGLIKVSEDGWSHIKNYLAKLSLAQIAKLDMTALLQALVEEGVSIVACKVAHQWFEIDSIKDLNAADKLENLFEWSKENNG